MNRREAMGVMALGATTGVISGQPAIQQPKKSNISVNFRLVAWAKEESTGGTSLHFVGAGDPIFVEESLQSIMNEYNLRSSTGPEKDRLFFLELTRVN